MADKEILTISPSAIDVFLGCPRKYHFRYTAKISEPELREKSSLQWLGSDERGTMMHRAMELYVSNVILPISGRLDTIEAPHGSADEAKLVTALDAITFAESDFQMVWTQAVKEIEEELQKKSTEALTVPVSAKEKELAEAETDCRDAILYLIQMMKLRHQYPVSVEMKFGKRRSEEDGEELPITRDGEDDFAICGSIDRVDYDTTTGKYIVVDYKTGSIDKKRKLRAGGRDDLLQDRVYALAFEKMHPGKEVAASRYVFPSCDNQEIYEEMNAESKSAFEDRLWEEINAIRAKVDKACKGNKTEFPDCENTCKYCGYAELCDACDVLDAQIAKAESTD